MTPEPDANVIRIGISACLLGDEVRFDGGHKRDVFLLHTVGQFVEYVSVCPEVELGLGIPREAIRLLEGEQGEARLVGAKSGTDHTESMRRYAAKRVGEIAKMDLSGYVLKRASPSCGLFRIKIYRGKGVAPRTNGRGLFAEALKDRLPLLPVEEEGRLNDPGLRENFLERVFAYRRLRRVFTGRWRYGDLVAFHTAEKLNLMAHDPQTYKALGRLVAGGKQRPRAEVAAEYQTRFMAGMEKIATTRKQTNVLQHAQGYFKKLLSRDERAELNGVIEDYRQGLIPLIVPMTLVRHHVRRHGVEYLAGQIYLEPNPKELMLRNHV